jgi:hypothetical protein
MQNRHVLPEKRHLPLGHPAAARPDGLRSRLGLGPQRVGAGNWGEAEKRDDLGLSKSVLIAVAKRASEIEQRTFLAI